MSCPSFTWLKAAIVLGGIAATAWLLSGLGHIVRLLLIGGLLAYLLDPLARAIESRGASRKLATSLVCTALATILAGVTYLASPVIVSQVTGLRQGFSAADVDHLLEEADWVINGIITRVGGAPVDVPALAHEWISRQAGSVVALVPSVISVVADIIIVPFIMFFLLRDGPDMKRGFIRWLPNRYFEFALTVVHKSSGKLSGYLRGQATAALVVGILASIALWVIGVDFYLVIGLFAGLANMVPYLGPFAGGVLAVCVSALTTGSFDTAIWIIAAFAIIQVIDNTLVQPLVLSRNVEMHPLGVILTVIVGGQLFGFWGLLLAVPLAAIAKVLITEIAGNLRRFRLA